MNRVVHFEIEADKPKRAINFYKTVFGWKFEKWKGSNIDYWVIYTGRGPGINGGLSKRRTKGKGSTAFVCTVQVASLDKTARKIKKTGGSVTSTMLPVRGVGWMAMCKDTEGNTFGLIQNDRSAK